MQEDVNSTPIDFDFSEEGDNKPVETQETTAKDSSTEENKGTVDESKSDEDEVSEPIKADEAKNEDDAEEPNDELEDRTVKKGAEARNEQLNMEIRDLVAKKNALAREVEEATARLYKPQSVEELEETGMSDVDARFEALRQEQAIDKYNSHVTALTSDINMEALQVTHDFPIFDPESSDYDPKFAEAVAKQYTKLSGLQTDPNTGYVTQANVLPYEFYKSYAEARNMGAQRGEINGKKAAQKQMNSAETPSSAAPKQTESDPLMAALLRD
jgi:hypothetical protein